MTVVKEVISAPANGQYYVPGEQIVYTVTTTNTSDVTLYNARTYDPLLRDGFLGGVEWLPAGGWTTDYVYYTVTELDAERGFISNIAYAVAYDEYGKSGNEYIEYSNEVTVLCGYPMGSDPFGILHSIAVTLTEESLPLTTPALLPVSTPTRHS